MFRIRSGDSSSAAGSSTFWMDDNWVDVDENFSERLVSPDDSSEWWWITGNYWRLLVVVCRLLVVMCRLLEGRQGQAKQITAVQ